MEVDEDVQLCATSEADDMKTLDSYSSVLNNANGPQAIMNNIDNGIDDLGKAKEDNQVAHTMVKDHDKDVALQPPIKSLELVESLSVSQISKVDVIQSNYDGGNGSLVCEDEELGAKKIEGSRKPEDECNNKELSVRVVYSSLPSRSKRKLEELLHQWSEWHTQNFMMAEDSADCLESGEETYFPALWVGSEKSLAVSFSMDIHVRKRQRKESISLNNDGSPLYDRGYAFGLASDEGICEEGASDLREAPRCFNCGSYNHPLSECQKPRDNAAVNSARKQFLSKKNQSSGLRVQTRYYQESPGGKFDGLKPGALSAETRKLLGLGELDPPPWLNRMRELGYPLGYLDLEEEDQHSGITIFDDEESQNTGANSDIPLDVKSRKKMTVEFPGINAPIPENADRWIWTAPATPSSDFSRNQADNRWSHARESMSKHFRGMHGLRNPIDVPHSHFGLGLSPPPHSPNNYFPREPFSPRGVPIPGSPHHNWRPSDTGRPFLHYNYGSL